MGVGGLTDVEAKTARQWALQTKIPYATLLAAIKDGRLEAMRFSPRGQFYITEESLTRFLEESKVRARES
jgi:hypothetical protein